MLHGAREDLDPAKIVKWYGEGGEDWIAWISPFGFWERNVLSDDIMGMSEISSCSPCLIARVPPASDRA